MNKVKFYRRLADGSLETVVQRIAASKAGLWKVPKGGRRLPTLAEAERYMAGKGYARTKPPAVQPTKE